MRVLSRRPMRAAIGGMVLLSLVGFVMVCAALAQDTPASEDAKSDSAKAQAKAVAMSPTTYVVPANATVPELLKFISRIDGMRPELDSETDVVKFLTMSRTAILKASEKILSSRPNDEQEVRRSKPSCMPTRF